MTKNIKIDGRTHVRIKKAAIDKGRLVGHLAAELINLALDAQTKKPAKAKP